MECHSDKTLFVQELGYQFCWLIFSSHTNRTWICYVHASELFDLTLKYHVVVIPLKFNRRKRQATCICPINSYIHLYLPDTVYYTFVVSPPEEFQMVPTSDDTHILVELIEWPKFKSKIINWKWSCFLWYGVTNLKKKSLARSTSWHFINE